MAMTSVGKFLWILSWMVFVYLCVLGIASLRRERKFRKLGIYSRYRHWRDNRE